jgi:phage/plasmid-like protein (TIGR03299 family)
MGHNLNKTNDKWSFAAKGEKAWHGLGQYVDKAMTAEEAIELAGLDYEVQKRTLFTPDQDGNFIEVPGYFTNVRVDTNDPLGVVTKRYTIVQNREAFAFFNHVIDEGEAIFETAGALGKGERIFVTAKLPDDMEVRGEKVEKYLLLTNSHDGGSAITVGFTPIRVVCNNTLQASLGRLSNKVTIPHIASAKDRLEEAFKVMGIASTYMNKVNHIFESMSTVRVSDSDIDHFLEQVFVPKKKDGDSEVENVISDRMRTILADVKEYTMNHPTQTTEAAKGTLWGLYNGVSGYFTHVKDYKSSEQRMKDLIYNGASDKIEEAFRLANTMI